ncbi:hypothetical protein LDENG_00019490 [Lucifuga dentata]|nr:hypothetical protein LDENG_00019490 [Lucifuga dentata]
MKPRAWLVRRWTIISPARTVSILPPRCVTARLNLSRWLTLSITSEKWCWEDLVWYLSQPWQVRNGVLQQLPLYFLCQQIKANRTV